MPDFAFATGVEALAHVDEEVDAASRLPPYSAVSELWVCLVKFANTLPTVGEEPEQVVALVRRLDRETSRAIVTASPFATLVNLEPPLEKVLAHPRERLHALQVGRELTRMRRRSTDPKAALSALVSVLNRVRDKKMHGFKTPDGARDLEILEASAILLRNICKACSALLSREQRGIGEGERLDVLRASSE
ncbi:MAG: hypothetical protein ABI689_15320 [Thermoanaerobaculia bacterium]